MSAPAPTTSTLDFLAELQATFGKKHKGTKAATPARPLSSSDEARRRNRLAFPNVQSDPASGANAIAAAADFLETWQPTDRVTWVQAQTCRCCGGTTTYIAGEYVAFKRRTPEAFGHAYRNWVDKSHAHIWRRADSFPDLWHMEHQLPHSIEEHAQSVAQCITCLRAGPRVEELWSLAQRAILTPKADPEPELPGFAELLAKQGVTL